MASRLLIVTTHNDPSLELLAAGSKKAGMEPAVLRYGSDVGAALRQRYSVVYFRDPFNDTATAQTVARVTVDQVRSAQPDAYYVDHVSSFESMMAEDKWEQHRQLGDLMPRTSLLESFECVPSPGTFVKKRISSRSKGVIFAASDVPVGALPADYLLQQRLDIAREYRIFMVKGRLVLPAAVKSSKAAGQHSKVIGLEHSVDAVLRTLCERVYAATRYDFTGLDVAQANGRYYLLEVNRSCQFKVYHRLTGINLAEEVCQALRTSGAA